MKKERSLVDLASRALSADARRERHVPPNVRARAIDAVSDAIRSRSRRRTMRWVGGLTLAVAATLMLAFGLRGTREPARTPVASTPAPAAALAAVTLVDGDGVVHRGGQREALTAGSAVRTDDRIVVADGSRTSFTLAQGTRLELRGGGELLVVGGAPTYTFALTAGIIRADVAKLAGGERFVIRGPDAEIEVRGTSFDVSVGEADRACDPASMTHVSVREGTVAVRSGRSETLVQAGETWPGCRPPSATAPAEASVRRAPAASSSERSAATPPATSDVVNRLDHRAPSAPSSASSSSDLARQNDLYAQALARKGAGDAKGAIAVLDELLARFPNGHLSQSARAERMKLLRNVDAGRARVAAREYLTLHRNGFARGDAELILATPE